MPSQDIVVDSQKRGQEMKEKRKAEMRGLSEQQLINQIKLLKERAYR